MIAHVATSLRPTIYCGATGDSTFAYTRHKKGSYDHSLPGYNDLRGYLALATAMDLDV